MRSTIWFSMLRLGILFVVGFLLWLAGVGGWLWLALTVVISAVISYFALAIPRNAMANDIATRVTGFKKRLDAGTRAEDDK